MGYTPTPVFPCCLNLSSRNGILSETYKAPCIFLLPRNRVFISRPKACGLSLQRSSSSISFPSTEGETPNSRLCSFPQELIQYLSFRDTYGRLTSFKLTLKDHLTFSEKHWISWVFCTLHSSSCLVLSPLSPWPHLHSHRIVSGAYLTTFLYASLWFRICFPGHLM